MLDIDEKGLDNMDRQILLTIIEKFNGGPVGLTTSRWLSVKRPIPLKMFYEPFLIQQD
jgi:Holliday junction DNA helicase RuvB